MIQTKFVDTHAHLTDVAFDEDRNFVIKKSGELGVGLIITSGFNYSSSVEAVKLANDNLGVYASIGYYPENILELNAETENDFINLAKSDKVVAIGEIGLQYTDNMPDRESQKRGLIRQLEIAHELHLPVVIHCRDAYGAMVELLKQNKSLLSFGGTVHCFSGSKEIANELLKLGLRISVGGVSTFKNAQNLRETLKEIPIDRILLETDCPYLTPHPYRGQKNSPCFIPTIAESLANLKGLDGEEVARITTKNARELFKI